MVNSIKLKIFSVWPKIKPKTTEIIFSPYFHFKRFPPLSHTHSSLTHALPLSKLDCSDPHTEPNGTIHTDAPRSKLDVVVATKHLNDPSSDPVDAHDEFSFSVSHSDPLIFLRSTLFPFLADNLISPIHPLITSVLTPTHTAPTHCDASSLLLFLLLLYIIFLGLWL